MRMGCGGEGMKEELFNEIQNYVVGLNAHTVTVSDKLYRELYDGLSWLHIKIVKDVNMNDNTIYLITNTEKITYTIQEANNAREDNKQERDGVYQD